MRRPARAPRWLPLALGAALASTAAAEPDEGPAVELVYTAPVETSLEAPDLRPPARVWLELIRTAHRTIDLEQMYAVSRPGGRLEGVIDALEEAAARGVRIRMLVEKKMLRASDPPTLERLRRVPGLQLHVLEFRKVAGRDAIVHAKFLVVDGVRAFLGSQNFDWRSLEHVHETGVRIDDAAIAARLEAIFEHDFAAARAQAGQDPAPAPLDGDGALSDDKVRLVASPPDLLPPGIGASLRELPRLLGRARREITLQILTYSTHGHGGKRFHAVDDALRAAAARGVTVRLLVSDWGTGREALADLRALAALPTVKVKVVTLPQAAAGCIPFARVIHSKTVVIDGQVAWAGTSNLEAGYLDSSRNVELVVEDAPFAARLGRLQEQLWRSPYAAPLRAVGDYPKPVRECPLPERPPLPPPAH